MFRTKNSGYGIPQPLVGVEVGVGVEEGVGVIVPGVVVMVSVRVVTGLGVTRISVGVIVGVGNGVENTVIGSVSPLEIALT